MSSSGELLSVEPQELKFPFELKKQISSSLQLSNNTENYIAFKVKTTNPKKYCVRPNTGVVLPRSTSDFSKESGNLVEECKLRVLYVSPPQPPSPVPEGSEEGSSPRGSISENGNFNGSSDFTSVPKSYTETEEPSSEEKAMILKLTEEKKAAIQQANQLRQELELMRRESQKSRGGISFLYVVLIALFGVLLGYILRKK
ncbi:Vesicle-associated protein 1-2 [Ranunculus cassubicifolius]